MRPDIRLWCLAVFAGGFIGGICGLAPWQSVLVMLPIVLMIMFGTDS